MLRLVVQYNLHYFFSLESDNSLFKSNCPLSIRRVQKSVEVVTLFGCLESNMKHMSCF